MTNPRPAMTAAELDEMEARMDADTTSAPPPPPPSDRPLGDIEAVVGHLIEAGQSDTVTEPAPAYSPAIQALMGYAEPVSVMQEPNGVTPGGPDSATPQTLRLRKLMDLKVDDSPTLLGPGRYLCRGGLMLLAGPTGIGKSAFTLQMAMAFALGRDHFGIEPSKPLRILLIQGENDEGDLAEMREGVIEGMDLSTDDLCMVADNIHVLTSAGPAGDDFFPFLESAIRQHTQDHGEPPDMMFIDPVYSYLGGDASSQEDVSKWLRNGLQAIALQTGIAVMIIHHTNKPLSGTEKRSAWAAGDFSYLGSGSAEWANAPRAVLAIRSLGDNSVFELRAAKRGKRLQWRDSSGQITDCKYIAHDKRPGVICWREADPHEIAAVKSASSPGRKESVTEDDVVFFLEEKGPMLRKDLQKKLADCHGVTSRTVSTRVTEALKNGLIRLKDTGFLEASPVFTGRQNLLKEGKEGANDKESETVFAIISDKERNDFQTSFLPS